MSVEGGMLKQDLLDLLNEVKLVFERESSLVRVKAKRAVFVGDTHGDFESSKYVFDNFDLKLYTLVFLGDYVDRGPCQLENIVLLLQKKLENPDKVVLLRGNHETQSVNRFYGFLAELLELYGGGAVAIWRRFNEVFSFMPYGCLVNGEILAIHGGLASGLTTLEQIENLSRGEVDPTDPVVFQLLWNDPKEGVEDFVPSGRGEGIMFFGRNVVEDFESRNKVSLIIRSHEAIAEGAKYLFTATAKNKMITMFKQFLGSAGGYPGRVLTVFSCRYYEGCDPKVAKLEAKKISFQSLTGG